MHLSGSHTSIFSSTPPSSDPPSSPMQPTATTSNHIPSLSFTHPINGNPTAQHLHNLATGIPDSSLALSSSPASPPQPPPRNTKRLNSTRNTSTTATTTQAKTAAQLAKQEIRSKLREDWQWPPPPTPPPSIVPTPNPQSLNLPSSDSAWHERGEGFDTDPSISPPTTPTTQSNPYRYDSPDAVSAAAEENAEGKQGGKSSPRKRKRRSERMLREEMRWNEGLRYFVQRRDAWSGARMLDLHRLEGGRDECRETERAKARKTTGAAPVTTTTVAKSNGSSTNGGASEAIYHDDDCARYDNNNNNNNNNKATLLPNPNPHPHPRPSSSLPTPLTAAAITQIPLAPPILPPSNPVRASITPTTYPSIYSKIVIQGLSPTVPINLGDVVGALVWGWKENDEWPPKSEEPGAGGEMLAGGGGGGGVGVVRDGGRRLARRGMGKVRRVLGLRVGGGGGGEEGGEEREEGEKGKDRGGDVDVDMVGRGGGLDRVIS